MKKRSSAPIPGAGAGSLLAAFGIVCLTVFALLTLSTAQAEKRLADSTIQAAEAYYEADLQAAELFARLRSGEIPEQVQQEDNLFSYRCPVSPQQHLQVILEKTEAGWTVLCWQLVADVPDGETPPLEVWSPQEGNV